MPTNSDNNAEGGRILIILRLSWRQLSLQPSMISLSNGTFRGGAAESHAAFSAYICRVGLGSVMARLTNGSGLLTFGEFGAVLAQTGDRSGSTRPAIRE